MIRQQGYRRATRTFALLALLSLSAAPLAGQAQAASGQGLSVNSQGQLTRHGTPYRGIGVNYYDAFLRTLRNGSDTSYEEGFAKLGANGIPFARFAAGAYQGSDFQLYLTDKDAYLRRLDAVVQAAQKSNVGLIASVFWNINAVSDAVREPRERWGDASSQTRQFMRRYTQDIVSRYVNSPAIWGWEFSCELSLPVDLAPGQGNGQRMLRYETFRSAALDFAQTVRAIDPNRILLTGNSLPRAAAYHAAKGGSMGPDTEDQFARILLRDNPGPYSPICIHAAPSGMGRYFADRRVSYQELLETCMRIGQSVGKPVYLEEFVPNPGNRGGFGFNQKQYFSDELKAIEASNIPLASIWVYDRKLAPDRSNITADNGRSYMLSMIAAFNRSVHGQ